MSDLMNRLQASLVTFRRDHYCEPSEIAMSPLLCAVLRQEMHDFLSEREGELSDEERSKIEALRDESDVSTIRVYGIRVVQDDEIPDGDYLLRGPDHLPRFPRTDP